MQAIKSVRAYQALIVLASKKQLAPSCQGDTENDVSESGYPIAGDREPGKESRESVQVDSVNGEAVQGTGEDG
jgi:hypothetical protein